MVCAVRMYERPVLSDPVLIEGLPGIGFVANISALHLIQELKAKLFAEIRSSSFQDFAVTAKKGETRFPVNELYYHNRRSGERDLIILYGNTQALTTVGQYELCGRVLDIAEDLGCNYVVTLGGLRVVERKVDVPKLYCAASDKEMLNDVLSQGAKIIGGQIFGVAGLLVGLAKLRGMRGFCLLGETPGFYPDAKAAREVLDVTCKMLGLRVDLGKLDVAAEATRGILESFGVVGYSEEERKRRESRHWLI